MRLETATQVKHQLRELLGGEEKLFPLTMRKDFHGGVLVNADVLGEHVDPARSEFLPYLLGLLEAPFEVWMQFERHRVTGRYATRYRYIKVIETPGRKGMLLVANASRGVMEAWTIIPMGDLKYLQRQRSGKLIFGR